MQTADSSTVAGFRTLRGDRQTTSHNMKQDGATRVYECRGDALRRADGAPAKAAAVHSEVVEGESIQRAREPKLFEARIVCSAIPGADRPTHGAPALAPASLPAVDLPDTFCLRVEHPLAPTRGNFRTGNRAAVCTLSCRFRHRQAPSGPALANGRREWPPKQ